MTFPLVSIALDAFSIFFAIILLYGGLKFLVVSGSNRMAWLAMVLGLLFCMAAIMKEYAAYNVIARTLEAQKNRRFSEDLPPNTWSPSLSGVDREKLGYHLALQEYYATGTIATYLNRDKQTVVFAPNQLNIREREAVVASVAKLTVLAEERYFGMTRKICWAIFALFGAVLAGQRFKRSRKPFLSN